MEEACAIAARAEGVFGIGMIPNQPHGVAAGLVARRLRCVKATGEGFLARRRPGRYGRDMAKKFERLDEEQRALHQSWDDVGRVVLLVTLTAAVVWAPCALLRKTVHVFGDELLERAGTPGVSAALGLLAALAVAGLIRGFLHRYPQWREVERDGIDVALGYYGMTAGSEDPTPRLKAPAFALMARKALATFLTLVTGGSGGLEGPVVLIGESAGAGVARVMAARSAHELRTYQVAGIAAAVSTLLNAPFAAALFALEIVYADRIIYRKLAYCLLAATVAYVLNTQAFGTAQPLFVAPARTGAYHFSDYVVSALVAIAISTPVALAFGLAMKNTRLVVERINPMLRGLVGGLGTGAVAIAVATILGLDTRHVLGMGDWTLRQLLSHGPGEVTAVGLLLMIVVAKMLATAFTVQSGGSAGLLFPSMVLGGTAGAATGRALQLLGLFEGQEVSLFIVVGVASALVGMVGVPMAAIALTLEVFGPEYGPPTILACGLTYVLTLRLSIYDRQEVRGRAIEDTGEDEATAPPMQASQAPMPAPSTPPPTTPPSRRRRRR